MQADFVKQVTNALETLRRHQIEQLGIHPLLYQLRNLVKQHAGFTDDELQLLSPVALGDQLREILVTVIATLQPITPEDPNLLAWRHYIILHDYFVVGRSWSEVADRLAVARARFYDYRRQAISALATTLVRLERTQAEGVTPLRDNLPHPPYTTYVPRYDEQGVDYVEMLIEKLKNGRAWFIASDGAPGVGKTTIAYETALRCKERRIFTVIIWASAKQQILRAPDTFPVATYVTSINTILDLIGTTAENRSVLSVDSYAQKVAIVQRLLAGERCLLIVDNLESLDPAEQQKIFVFLENLPPPSRAIITGRQRHFIGSYTITIMGMKQAEALHFMREEAERRSVPPLEHGDAEIVHKATHGNPLAMQQVIGLIQSLGCTLADALAFGEIQSHDQMLDFMYAEAYDMLKPAEQQILHVLPLFTDLADSEAIRAASDVRSAQLSLGLQHLYRAFLIQRVGESRYDLLPFARQFLGSRQRRGIQLHAELSLVDFLTAAHRRLVTHYVDYLAVRNLDEQIRYLKHERRNILGLMEWCYANAEWQSVIDLVNVMGRPLGTLRYLDTEILWGYRAMEACEQLADHQRREWFKVYCVAWPHIYMNEAKRAKAREMIEESVKVAQEFDYVQLQALALRNLGRLIMLDGDHITALALLEESLALWDENGDLGEGWVAHTLSAIGEAQYHLGDYDRALESLLQAWRLRKKDGDTDGIAAATSDIALVLLAKGQADRARFWSDHGLMRASQIAKPARAYAYAHQRRAELEHRCGAAATARTHARTAIDTYEALGMLHWVQSINEWLTTVTADPAALIG